MEFQSTRQGDPKGSGLLRKRVMNCGSLSNTKYLARRSNFSEETKRKVVSARSVSNGGAERPSHDKESGGEKPDT